jgi:hypothetical protein
MQKSTKVLLGIASLWPIIYMFLFFVFVFSMALGFRGGGDTEPGIQPMMALVFGLHLLTMLIIMALTVFYIVDVFRNERVDKDKKALWAIVIFMGNAIAMPIYWYLYFWKEPSTANQVLPGQLNDVNTAAWTNEARGSRHEQQQYAPPSQPPNWRE